jgi:hypothetical protein
MYYELVYVDFRGNKFMEYQNQGDKLILIQEKLTQRALDKCKQLDIDLTALNIDNDIKLLHKYKDIDIQSEFKHDPQKLKEIEEKLSTSQITVTKWNKLIEYMGKDYSVQHYVMNRQDELKSIKKSKEYSTKIITQELYDILPQSPKHLRMCFISIRDQIIQLNYTFFGYIASHTFINNTTVIYEDKLQSALTHFCECWWWFKWKGDNTHKGYRQDLSFGVFFKPRIGEMIERELNEVKYSLRRALCIEAGKQLGKHWAQVRYEDLSKVDLPIDKLNSLKAIFGAVYWADLSEQELYMPAPKKIYNEVDYLDSKFENVVDLLMYEMILRESTLSDKDLEEISDLDPIKLPVEYLKQMMPLALDKLYKKLHTNLDNTEAM